MKWVHIICEHLTSGDFTCDIGKKEKIYGMANSNSNRKLLFQPNKIHKFHKFLWYIIAGIYRVNHKSLRDFRPLRYSSRDGHAEGKHVNRGRDTPIFCPTLQVLDMSTLGDAADVSPVTNQVPATHVARVWQELDYRIDICRVPKGWHSEHL